MAEKEQDFLSAEDLDIEIVDLEESEEERAQHKPARPFRLTRRQRTVGTLLTLLLFITVISVLLTTTTGVGSLLTHALFPPNLTATATSRLGEFSFYLVSNPSWGQFTLDGQPIQRLPTVGSSAPLKFAPGRHTIIWRVAPFNARTCIFTVESKSIVRSPCLQDGSVSMNSIYLTASSNSGGSGQQVLTLSFSTTLKDLSGEQRQALTQQIQKYLDGFGDSETVATGERYAVSEDIIQANPALCHMQAGLASCFARASEPLRAAFHLQLDTSTSRDDPCVAAYLCSGDNDCRQLCGNFFWTYEIDQKLWNVSAVAYASWSYTTLSGKEVASNQPVSSIRGSSSVQQIPLQIAWDKQGWRVGVLAQSGVSYTTSGDQGSQNFLVDAAWQGYVGSNPVCDQASQGVSLLINALAEKGSDITYVEQTYGLSQHIAAGCLVVVGPPDTVSGNSATPTLTPVLRDKVHLLVRFGVILAADDAARKLWPFLPVANAHEQGVAQQILAA